MGIRFEHVSVSQRRSARLYRRLRGTSNVIFAKRDWPMIDISDPHADAENAFRSGCIDRLDNARLRTHLLTLANDGPDLKRDLIRAAWVQHVLVERQLDELDRKSA